jgi:antitoxin ParD1/3/4
METITISLPPALKEFVEAQSSENGCSTPSEYVCSLIRTDQIRQAEQKLEALLLQGLEGDPIEVTEEWWEAFRARLVDRHRKVTAVE